MSGNDVDSTVVWWQQGISFFLCALPTLIACTLSVTEDSASIEVSRFAWCWLAIIALQCKY